MKKLTVALLALFLLGCPPARHEHPEITGQPEAEEIQKTSSGIIWRIVHCPGGSKSYVTKVPEGWIWHDTHSSIIFIEDKEHKWLRDYDLSQGHFDEDGKWIPNDNTKLNKLKKRIDIVTEERNKYHKIAEDLQVKIKVLARQKKTVKELSEMSNPSAFLMKRDASSHRENLVLKQMNNKLKKDNRTMRMWIDTHKSHVGVHAPDMPE